MQLNIKNKPVTWKSITLLISSFILFVLTGAIVRLFCLSIALDFSLSANTLNGILAAEYPLRLVMYFVFAGTFVYTLLTHRKVNSQSLKKPLLVAFSLVLVGLMLSSVLYEPLVKAETTAVTGYYLARPIPGADWYLGKLSDGTYYAINGSNWNDLTAVEPWQAVAPWATYASNYTALTQQALASVTYGTVYLKEVPFNYNLTIPANVQVIENCNGLTRTFINTANSQGSPYTISVDKVNTQYYMAQDGAGRILDSFTSTNVTSIIQTVGAIDGAHILIKDGIYPCNATISGNNVIVEGESWNTILQQIPSSTIGVLHNNWTSGNDNITITNLQIDGNRANLLSLADTERGIELRNTQNSEISKCYVHDCYYDGLGVWANSTNCLIKENLVENISVMCCIFVEGYTTGSISITSNNKVINNQVYSIAGNGIGINLVDAYNCEVSGNTISTAYIGVNVGATIGSLVNQENTVTGNNIQKCSFAGIQIITSKETTCTSNIINASNTALVAYNSTGLFFSNNQILNSGAGSNGILLENSSSSTISFNNIYNSPNDAILLNQNCITNILTSNIIDRATWGIVTSSGDIGNTISNNLIHDDTVSPLLADGIVNQASENIITGNTIMNCSSVGIYSQGTKVSITNNVLSTTNQGIAVISGSVNTYIQGNTFSYMAGLIINDANGINTIIMQNQGYNPTGLLANFFIQSGTYICDRSIYSANNYAGNGDSATFINGTIYTNIESPKQIFVSGGTVISITVNGQVTGLTSGSFMLQPKDTFKLVFSSTPNYYVMGQ